MTRVTPTRAGKPYLRLSSRPTAGFRIVRHVLIHFSFFLCLLHAFVPHAHAMLAPGDEVTECRHDNPLDLLDRLGQVFHQNLGGDHLEHYVSASTAPDSAPEAPLIALAARVRAALPRPDVSADRAPMAFGRRPPPGRAAPAPAPGRAPPAA